MSILGLEVNAVTAVSHGEEDSEKGERCIRGWFSFQTYTHVLSLHTSWCCEQNLLANLGSPPAPRPWARTELD